MIKEANKICLEVNKMFWCKPELVLNDYEVITVSFTRSYIKKCLVIFYEWKIEITVYENWELVHQSPYEFNEATRYNAAVYLLNVLTSSGRWAIL